MRTEYLNYNEIHVLDNFISTAYQDLLEKTFLSNEVELCFEKDIGHADARDIGNFGFGRTIRTDGVTCQKWDLICLPMIYDALHAIGKKIAWVKQGRVFMTTSGTPNKQDVFHIDFPDYHIAVLYYVHDSDGDTLLSTKVDGGHQTLNNIPYSKFYEHDSLDIYKRITPKKGRVVIFNGLRYHCATRPSKGYRTVINYNVL